MHYQEQSECQADDAYFNNNLQNLFTGSSFQGYVTYTGGCQSESAGDALAGGTCYEPVESGSNYWDSQSYPGFASPPSSSAPDAGGSDTLWPSPSAEASLSPEPFYASPPSSAPPCVDTDNGATDSNGQARSRTLSP